MQVVSFVEFRKHLSEYVGMARYADERIAVTHHGKVVGGFVSAEILNYLEELETQKDIAAYRKGLKSIEKHGTISHQEFKNQLKQK